MRDQQDSKSSVIHIKVIVQKTSSGYDATYDPPIIAVNSCDTTLRFQLDEPTPDHVVIDSVTISPLGQTQLSDPTITDNGKKYEVKDANTVKQTLNLKFKYKDKHGAALEAKSAFNVLSVEYPQVDNNPP